MGRIYTSRLLIANGLCNRSINGMFTLHPMSRRPNQPRPKGSRPIDIALGIAWDKNWSRTEFGRAMGVPPQHVTNWARRGLPPALHAKAAKVLGCPIEMLLSGKEIEKTSDYAVVDPKPIGLQYSNASPSGISPHEWKLVIAYRQADERHRHLVCTALGIHDEPPGGSSPSDPPYRRGRAPPGPRPPFTKAPK